MNETTETNDFQCQPVNFQTVSRQENALTNETDRNHLEQCQGCRLGEGEAPSPTLLFSVQLTVQHEALRCHEVEELHFYAVRILT